MWNSSKQGQISQAQEQGALRTAAQKKKMKKQYNKCKECGRSCLGFLCRACFNKLKKGEIKNE